MVELVPDNIERAFRALEGTGYRPSVPVTWEQFADADMRQRWIEEKHMQVLSFWSDEHRLTPVDLFVTAPFPFSEEYAVAPRRSLAGVGDARFVSLPTLIRMKEIAGRRRDWADIEDLRLVGGE